MLRLISNLHGGWKLFTTQQQEEWRVIFATESKMNCPPQTWNWVPLAGVYIVPVSIVVMRWPTEFYVDVLKYTSRAVETRKLAMCMRIMMTWAQLHKT